MKFNVRNVAFLFFIVGCITACSNNKSNPFSTMIPAGATSISYVHESDLSDGVSFKITSKPKSYDYVQGARQELGRSGYSLCKKSAISEWEPLLADDKSVVPNTFWMVELYARKDLGKFFVLRVVTEPTGNGSDWLQTVHLAVQTVPPGRQNVASVSEFCE